MKNADFQKISMSAQRLELRKIHLHMYYAMSGSDDFMQMFLILLNLTWMIT